MKKIFLIIALFITTNIIAQPNASMLKIKDASGRKILVTIDGRRFKQSGRILTVADLPTGMHRIKVYTYNPYSYRMAGADLVYSGRIMTKAGFIYRCVVDEYEGMKISQYYCTDYNGNFAENNHYSNNYNWNDRDWNENYWHGNNNNNDDHNYNNHYDNDGHNNSNNNYNGNKNNHYNNGNGNNQNYNSHNNNWNSNNDNGYNNNSNNNANNNGYNQNTMNQNQFNQFVETVKNNSFDSGKTTMIKSQLTNTKISTAQLKQLIDLYSFESSKLDIAKFGATKITDKQNLFTLNNCFEFDSTKEEFSKYIATLQ